MPVLLGSVFIFAIDFAQTSASEKILSHGAEYIHSDSISNLDDDGFWGKFRESVMKDRDKNDPNDSEHSGPSRGENDYGGGDDHGGGPGGRGGDGGHGGGGGHR